MDSEQQPILDWVNLPAEATTLSLWDTLHDGDLLPIESDLLARSLTLRFDVGYVRDFNSLPEGTRFVIKFSGVQSVRCFKTVSWPGEFSLPLGISREEERSLIEDYQSKCREESHAWSDFERLSGEGLEVSNATLARAPNAVAFQLGVLVDNDGSYVEAYIRAESVECRVGDTPVSLEQFTGLGEAYWEAFARRQSTQE
jgi:hypothetical protein